MTEKTVFLGFMTKLNLMLLIQSKELILNKKHVRITSSEKEASHKSKKENVWFLKFLLVPTRKTSLWMIWL